MPAKITNKYPLQDYQQAFIQAIKGNSQQLLPMLQQCQHQAIFIYQNNTRQTELAALKQVFPICYTLLGEPCFITLCRDFLKKSLGKTRDLNQIGSDFPLFLGQVIQSAIPRYQSLTTYPYLVDLAQVEFYLNAIYYMKDEPEINLNEIANLTPEQQQQLRFLFKSSVFLYQTSWPIFELWQQHERQQQAAELPAPAEPQYLLLHRSQFKPTITCLTRIEYELLLKLQHNHSLAEISALKLGKDLLANLPTLIQLQIFSQFCYD